MRGWTLAAGCLLLLPLSGCSGSASGDAGDDPLGADVDVTVTETTGAIRGIVVDEAIRPIAGATVRAGDAGLEAVTGDAGTFGFSKVEPGLHFLEVSKAGHFPVQLSVQVEAGVADPPLAKAVLSKDASTQPYYEAVVFDGFIECTTSLAVLCGAPNTLEPAFCEFLEVCYGNLTNDRFTWTEFHKPGALLIQSEMAWESTQAASPNLSFTQEALTTGCPNTDLDTVMNGTGGPSPIYTQLRPPVLEEYQIGEECGIYYSVFSGEAVEGSFIGATVEQTFTMYTHTFYGFTPPTGWRFTVDGDPDVPA